MIKKHDHSLLPVLPCVLQQSSSLMWPKRTAGLVCTGFVFIYPQRLNHRGQVSLINQRFHMTTADFDLFLYGIKVNCVALRLRGEYGEYESRALLFPDVQS